MRKKLWPYPSQILINVLDVVHVRIWKSNMTLVISRASEVEDWFLDLCAENPRLCVLLSLHFYRFSLNFIPQNHLRCFSISTKIRFLSKFHKEPIFCTERLISYFMKSINILCHRILIKLNNFDFYHPSTIINMLEIKRNQKYPRIHVSDVIHDGDALSQFYF